MSPRLTWGYRSGFIRVYRCEGRWIGLNSQPLRAILDGGPSPAAERALKRNRPLDVCRQLRRLNADTGQSAPVQRSVNALRIAVPALSFLAGLAYAFVVIGPRVLKPFKLSWMVGDPATAYLGWAFFRQETHLTFRLGWSHGIGYPLGEPVRAFRLHTADCDGWLAHLQHHFREGPVCWYLLCPLLRVAVLLRFGSAASMWG